ncbi:MAG: A/G-specific adenine glycosylase [Syntrophaceae bacterium]|nr:A/G-specific adenine glycosylase [Syntrophaceae bacterium]
MKPPPLKKKIQTTLLRWFNKNKRDLPWRKTHDPYSIWVSEIMLQQTQVATVIPYYQKFLNSFPTIRHLAKAELSKVLKVWEGLGYYSRARNLHRASQICLNHFHGKIPDNLEDLLSLPGIGRSTAGAILSFAFNKEAPILDGNAKRVLSRLFAVPGNSGERKTEQFLWEISESLIPKGYANPFNQALMDLGALICTPKDPQCYKCPLCNLCKAKASGKPEKFPSRSVKKKIPHIRAVCAVIQKDGKVLLKNRPPKGLLGGLWEFPNWKIEGKQRSRLRLSLRNYIRKQIGMNVEVKNSIGTFKQAYSHFKITLQVFKCQFLNKKGKGKWVPIKELIQLPMSRIHRKIAERIKVIT